MKADSVALPAKARAFYTLFNTIADDSYERTVEWFNEHPNEPYCYWANDYFISIADKYNEDILRCHPEIEDIDDHTVVEFKDNTVVLTRFCPKMKSGIKAVLDAGITESECPETYWTLCKHNDNYMIRIFKK